MRSSAMRNDDNTPTESVPDVEVREQILFGGQWFDCPGVRIHNMRHRGLWWDADDPGARERREPIRAMILHHTGGEGGVDQVYRTLKNRKNAAGRPSPLSVHFVIEGDTIYQLADVATVTQHAGSANGWSVGVEICSRGAGPNLKGHKRNNYIDHVHGARVNFLAFTSNEVHAAQRLCKAFTDLTGLPLRFPTAPGSETKVLREKLSERELRNWYGLLGHYHVSRRKIDPAPDVMDAIQRRAATVPQ